MAEMTEVSKISREAENKMQAAIDAVKKQFSTVRTGRAHPSLVEGIKVDYYGTLTMLKQLASIAVPEARMIVIQPWDKGAMQPIEKAIMASDIGITPSNDGKNIRLTMPQLTHERRDELKKLIHKMAEEGKVSIRNTRHAANDKAQTLEKDKMMTEDDKFDAKERVQKLTEKFTKEIDDLLKDKEKELEG